MKAFLALFALMTIANAQAPPFQINGSASVGANSSQIQIQGENSTQNSEQGQNKGGAQVSGGVIINGPPRPGAAQNGGGADIGSFLQGVSNGIGDFIKGFAQPIEAVGKTFCFAIDSGTNQLLRLDDFAGKTFSISVDGVPIYNGTIQGGTRNGSKGTGSNGSKRHHHGQHHFDSKKAMNLIEKLKGEKENFEDKRHHARRDAH
ncbi:uncharacterized protein [Onthophagus taurus]|uniref:uncharacterized protein n=1 Tax=Onthophagus taurus TaxID=166361 RepID=UPI0039BDEF91